MPILLRSKPRSEKHSATGLVPAQPARRFLGERWTSLVRKPFRPLSIPQLQQASITPSQGHGRTRPTHSPSDAICLPRDLQLRCSTGGFKGSSKRPGSSLLGGGMACRRGPRCGTPHEPRNFGKGRGLEGRFDDGGARGPPCTPLWLYGRGAEGSAGTINRLALKTSPCNREGTRSNPALAGAILSASSERRTSSPLQNSTKRSSNRLRKRSPQPRSIGHFVNCGPEAHPADSRQFKDRYFNRRARRGVRREPPSRACAAPKDIATQAFAYANFGKPGTVTFDRRIADLGLRTVRFANNVRLNIKRTDFEAGRVRFIVRLGDGLLDLPKNEPGLAPMMTMTSAAAGLKKQSLQQLQELLAGKMITVGTSVEEDAFVASGATTPQDLALQMKVSAAYLLDPGYRDEAAHKWTESLPDHRKAGRRRA